MKYSDLKAVAEQLRQCADVVTNKNMLHDHPAIIAAEESGSDLVLRTVATALVSAEDALHRAVANIEHISEKVAGNLDEEDIDAIAAIATAYEESDDPSLAKQASVIDQLLINFAQKNELERHKRAQYDEINRLREKYRNQSHERAYENPRKEHERDIQSTESGQLINKQIKRYRPMEASLSTRYCPDHPGTGVTRIAEFTYQCALDKKIYNWAEGFKTMKGNEVPGGSVSEQTGALGDRALEQMNFSTREGRLTSTASDESGLVKKAQNSPEVIENVTRHFFSSRGYDASPGGYYDEAGNHVGVGEGTWRGMMVKASKQGSDTSVFVMAEFGDADLDSLVDELLAYIRKMVAVQKLVVKLEEPGGAGASAAG
jgi:hypothetical protein